MVKEFFLFVSIVFASSFELKDFELDYNYVDSSNISYGELFLGHSGGMPQPNDSPGGGDHSKFSVPPTSSSKPPTTTLRPTPTSTTTTTLGRPSSRSVPQPPIATSAANSQPPNEDEGGAGKISGTVEEGDRSFKALGKVDQKQHEQDGEVTRTTKAVGGISQTHVEENRERTDIENSLIRILKAAFLESRTERDHPNPYGPVNFS